MNKYFNKKIIANGIKYDSKAEYEYHQVILQDINITNIVLQPVFLLQEAFKYNGKTIRKMEYTADFSYEKNNQTYIVEIKSKYTAKLTDYILRKKMFLFKNQEKNFIEIIK